MRRVVKTPSTAARAAQRPKTERGDQKKPDRGTPAGGIHLPKDAASTEAFRQVAAALFEAIAVQQQEVGQGNPVGIHQMRIGLRRMRTALSIFSGSIDPRQATRFKRELKWIAGRLAPARDLHLLELKFKSAQIDGASPSFLKRLAADRASAFAKATAAVEQPRFGALMRELRRWIEAGGTTAKPATEDERQSAREFAKQVLAQRARSLIKKLDKLEQLDDEQRHRVRIAAKKLNYAIGFFETLFAGKKNGKRLERFRKQLKTLLDALGALNDLAVHQQLAGKFAHRPKAKLDAAALRQLSELDASEFRKQMKAAVKAAAKLANDPLFGD